jgi:ubiquinone/menaquinone biosynthesis C-methylase UbiE
MSSRGESLSFDQAAGYYDQTRGLPEPLATGGIQLILDRLQGDVGRRAQLLEVGTGTGRIGVPLLERGANLLGCDLSSKMLARQRAKWPAARLAQADAIALPFGTGQFDGVLTIHVLHLVGAWQAALREIRRVLRPSGVFVNSWNPHTEQDIDTELRDFWRSRVDAYGAHWRRPGVQNREELMAELERMEATVEEVTAARTVTAVVPQAVIDSIASRIYSDTWEVPEDVFRKTLGDVQAWAAQTYGDLTQPEPVERLFTLDIVTFNQADSAAG